jgi:hypothetical protein
MSETAVATVEDVQPTVVVDSTEKVVDNAFIQEEARKFFLRQVDDTVELARSFDIENVTLFAMHVVEATNEAKSWNLSGVQKKEMAMSVLTSSFRTILPEIVPENYKRLAGAVLYLDNTDPISRLIDIFILAAKNHDLIDKVKEVVVEVAEEATVGCFDCIKNLLAKLKKKK